MLSSGKEGLPLLVDEVFPDVPQRQWVNNFPSPAIPVRCPHASNG